MDVDAIVRAGGFHRMASPPWPQMSVPSEEAATAALPNADVTRVNRS